MDNVSGAVADHGADQGVILVRHPLEALMLISAGYLNATAILGDTLSKEQREVLLAETRKFGLSLCAAHQLLAQLDKVDESLRGAVLASGTLIAFRVGGEDADVLRKEFTPWPAQTLVDLDNYVALIKPLRHGKVMEPFQIQTYDAPPHIKLQDGRSKSVTNYSRDNYGTPRAEVEAEILRWMEGMGQKASEATLKRIAGTIAPKKTAPRRNRG